ncbi:MAG: tyrosine 2,3-aminomutase [Blastocatellia bacterium]|nr:tyrosine 2,3-aminomutase [Blastocatellia bacterium]
MIINGKDMTIATLFEVAVNKEPVELDKEMLDKVKQTYDRVQEWGAEKHPVYGVNTGFGELAHIIIPPDYKSELQYNLLRSHAAGGGRHFPDEIVRAIMTARLNCLIRGYSGVSVQALQLLAEFLNRGIHPLIPEQGSLGASGDLAPLSHMSLPLIGDGLVRMDGQVRRSGEVLEEHGLKPVKPGFKEALALVNGTSAMTGAASIALRNAYRLLKIALLASADFVQCLRASTRAFDPRGHELRNHLGQIIIARELRRCIASSGLTQQHAELMNSISKNASGSTEVLDAAVFLQHAYSLRCIPQILGPVLDTLNYASKVVEEELNSCNDNPLFFETPEETFHGGNFHGQYVAMSCDILNIALTEVGVLAERQLNRLLDPHLNGDLPPFLASGDFGLFCGFEGAQYLATSIASENLDIAAPASIKSIPSNGSNQDVVSMGLIAARKSLQLCDNVTTILAVLIAACHQASHFIGQEKFNNLSRDLHQELSKEASLYTDALPISEIIARAREFILSNRISSLIAGIDFSQQA